MSRILYGGLCLLLCIAALMAGCTNQYGQAPAPSPTATPQASSVHLPMPSASTIRVSFQSLPASHLSSSELSDIVLAQDYQRMMGDLFTSLAAENTQEPLFPEMASSASTLAEAGMAALDRYNVSYPVENQPVSYVNAQVKAVYSYAVSQAGGTTTGSLSAAGMAEEQHLSALYGAMGRTHDADLLYLYGTEAAAERNNLRATVQRLSQYGVQYIPNYLAAADYNNIISTPTETVQIQTNPTPTPSMSVVTVTSVPTMAPPAAPDSSMYSPVPDYRMPNSDLIRVSFQYLPFTPINASEQQDIMYLQESQKMENDLYTTFEEQNPGNQLFAGLEQTTASLITTNNMVLSRYGITPINEPVGIFRDPQLQTLYDRLIYQGQGLVTDAMTAAVTSEEVHIADLSAAMSRTDNSDLQYIYSQELALARNNLRVLVMTLKADGISYAPQYLAPTAFNEIVGSPMETIPGATVTPQPTIIPTQVSTLVPTQTPVPSITPSPTIMPASSITLVPSMPGPSYVNQPNALRIIAAFQTLPASGLSPSEIADITYFQEAEKLQRDLYQYMTVTDPDDTLFTSMSSSADTLMTADNVILGRYNLQTPENEPAGMFQNTRLQQLYAQFTGQAGGTVPSALTVAAMSEEIHISDLTQALGRTNNADIRFIYNQELAASRNNLRAVVQQLSGYGQTYTPQYLSQNAFSDIVSSPMETIPTS